MLYPPQSFVMSFSHEPGAERTEGIVFPYQLESRQAVDLSLIESRWGQATANHFNRSSRFTSI